MKLKATCQLCKEVKVVNGQRQFDAWAKLHKHEDRQTEIEYKIGKFRKLECWMPNS